MSKNIDIICPLYNAESYIENLNKSLIKQKKVKINKKKERKNSGNIHSFSGKSCYTGCVMQGNPWICVCG